MKNITKTTIIAIVFLNIYMFGCKEVVDVNMEQIHQLQDSVTKIIPGVSAIDIKVAQQTELKVIIGDIPFYTENLQRKHDAAIKVGEIAMLLFGADNNVKSGKLIITKENRKSAWDKDPTDGIVVDMKIDSLREHDDLLLEFFSKMHK